MRRRAGLRAGLPARLDLREQHLPKLGGWVHACRMPIGKRRYLLWHDQQLLRRNHKLQPRLPEEFHLRQPPVCVGSRLSRDHVHATRRRGLLRHHRRWLRNKS